MSDFRVADMAMGGQGAPLVPFSEYLLYRREDETILLQNIGGIGNMTVMPAKAKPEEVYAFDTGPGNMIIDAVTAAVTGGKQTFDEGGRLGGQRHREPEAARLAPAGALLCPAAAQNHGAGAIWDTIYGEDTGLAEDTPYFRRGPGGDGHRSHGLVHRGRLRAVRAGAVPRRRAHRGRGGSYNSTLLGDLTRRFAPHGVKVRTQEELGWSSDAKKPSPSPCWPTAASGSARIPSPV